MTESRSPSGPALPAHAEVVIDVPRGGFVKHDDDGHVDYFSPLPCPFNYGSVSGTLAPDGDRIDAVVLGGRLAPGARLTVPVRGFVDFVDAGDADPKWVCSQAPLRRRDVWVVTLFFSAFGPIKNALNAARGKPGRTHCRGIHLSR